MINVQGIRYATQDLIRTCRPLIILLSFSFTYRPIPPSSDSSHPFPHSIALLSQNVQGLQGTSMLFCTFIEGLTQYGNVMFVRTLNSQVL